MEGDSYTEHPALQLRAKFSPSQLNPANNSAGEPLLDVIYTTDQEYRVFYISASNFLRLAKLDLATNSIKQLFETSLTKEALGTGTIDALQAVSDNLVIAYSGSKLIIVEVARLVGVSDVYTADGYRADLSAELPTGITGCNLYIDGYNMDTSK